MQSDDFVQEEERQPSISLSDDDPTQTPQSMSGKRKRDSLNEDAGDSLNERRTSFKRTSPGPNLNSSMMSGDITEVDTIQQEQQDDGQNPMHDPALTLHDHTNMNDHNGTMGDQNTGLAEHAMNMHEHAAGVALEYDLQQVQANDLQTMQQIHNMMALERAAVQATSRYHKQMQAVHPTDPNLDPSFATLSPPEPEQPINQAPPAPRLISGPSAGPNNSTPAPVNPVTKPQVGTEEWHRQRKDNHKEVERRRRETINEGINELAKIVPGCEKNKGSILSAAVNYIQNLKQIEATNIEKWSLEKLLTEQAINELSSTVDKLKKDVERAWREAETWKKACASAGITNVQTNGQQQQGQQTQTQS